MIVIIPARYGSTRLPGKPLIPIAGKPLIQRVYEQACRIPGVDRILIATDDARIAAAVEAFGGEVRLTPKEIATGSERVGFVAREVEAEVVVNLQGDEPLISPPAVAQAIRAVQNDPDLGVATLGCPLTSEREWQNPSVVKVLRDHTGHALYFSRAPIPFHRDMPFEPSPMVLRHIGVYVFRKAFLREYLSWPEGDLERREKLEQLRILERGHPIRVIQTEACSPGVDTPEDVTIVERLIQQREEER
ncbi:MAG: 3-deoxy-manno-octulosonate cytidylyltransferase [Calditrichaeota bacterium]|nr:MAG: 3-deoxy-manno-octulosonate cytidylyltransferase [Calditrichota bacterium]